MDDSVRYIVEALTGDQTVDLGHRLEAAGSSMDEYLVAIGDPAVMAEIMEHCKHVYLVAALPATLQDMATRAASGDAKAQEMVLKLFSENSPLKEQLALTPEGMTDDGLAKSAGTLMARLAETMKKVGYAQDTDDPDTGGGDGVGLRSV